MLSPGATAENENYASSLEQNQWSIIEWVNPIVQLPALSVDSPLIIQGAEEGE